MDATNRRNYFIDKKFQAMFALKSCLIVAASSVLIGVFLYYLSRDLTTVTIANTHVTAERTSDVMLPMIIKTLVLATIFNAILVITLTIYMSHRIAGPLFRICRDLEAFTDGDLKMTFRTRKTDELKPLVASLGDMGESFRARFSDIKKKCEELKRLAGDPGAGKETLAKKVEELGREIDWFKT